MTVQPLLLVDAPAITPYQYGLAAVAQPASTADVHWELGVEYEPIADYLPNVWPGSCFVGSTPNLDLPSGVGTVEGLPFSVYAGVDCSVIGYNEDYIMGRAQAILALGWQQAAELALWTGAGISNAAPVLNAAGVSETVGTVGMSIVQAVAALEKYMAANYLGVATIHATRDVSAIAKAQHQVVERSGKLQTILGTNWVFGGGYDGSGPSDAAPASGDVWMYATGLITVRRGEPFINGGLAQALSRSTNVQTVFAQQQTVLTVDGPIAAVSVDLTA